MGAAILSGTSMMMSGQAYADEGSASVENFDGKDRIRVIVRTSFGARSSGNMTPEIADDPMPEPAETGADTGASPSPISEGSTDGYQVPRASLAEVSAATSTSTPDYGVSGTIMSSEGFPMAVPWECRVVPVSLGQGVPGMCPGGEPEPDPAVVEVPAEAPAVAAAAPAVVGEPVAAVPVVSDVVVAEALRTVGLPGAGLRVQPGNGRTLVNFETNFYTEVASLAPTVSLLGQSVELAVRPVSYSWVFGDGDSRVTAGAGRPFPALGVTHAYDSAGTVRARVDVTYAADFRLEGGAWAPVPGSVTVTGEPVGLEVVEASPLLVG